MPAPKRNNERRNLKRVDVSVANQLAESLRGMQLTRAVSHDQQSVATSCVSFKPTSHSTSRCVTRGVSKRDVQHCLKNGTMQETAKGRVKVYSRGVTVIVSTDKVVITSWRSEPAKVVRLWKRALLRWNKRLRYAFCVWSVFPFIPGSHARWLLNLCPNPCFELREVRIHGRGEVVSVCFRAWVLFCDNQHAIRVSRILKMDPSPPARDTVRVRQLFSRWTQACHPVISLGRAKRHSFYNLRRAVRIWKWVIHSHAYTPLWSARYLNPSVDDKLWREFSRTRIKSHP